MKITELALTAASALTAVALTAGVAQAHPVTEQQAPIGFTAGTDAAGRALISVDAGSLVVEDNTLKIKTADGATVAGAPLTFRIDEFEFPIEAAVTGHDAVLTPRLDIAHATYEPVALPFENSAPWKSEYDREKDAWSRMTGTIGLGASVGALVGGIGGGAVGCVLGGIVGATVASATIIGLFGPFVPAAVVGCLGGIAAIGALGTLAGQIFVTAPVAIGAAIQYFATINAPFTAPAK